MIKKLIIHVPIDKHIENGSTTENGIKNVPCYLFSNNLSEIAAVIFSLTKKSQILSSDIRFMDLRLTRRSFSCYALDINGTELLNRLVRMGALLVHEKYIKNSQLSIVNIQLQSKTNAT